MAYILSRSWQTALGLLAVANVGFATEPNRDNVITSENQGYVMQFSHPPEWVVKDELPSAIRVKITDIPTGIPDITAKASVNLYWQTLEWDKMTTLLWWPLVDRVSIDELPSDIMASLRSGSTTSDQLDAMINQSNSCGGFNGDECVMFERSAIALPNAEGMQVEYALHEVLDVASGQIVQPDGPMRTVFYFSPFKDDMAMRVDIDLTLDIAHLWPSNGQFTDQSLKKLFEYQYKNSGISVAYEHIRNDLRELVESIIFQPVSELDPDIAVSSIYESSRIQISRRRDYTATASFSVHLPADWEITEIQNAPADANYETGSLITMMTLPSSLSVTGSPGAIYLILSGMPVMSLNPDDYFATAARWADQLSPDYEILGSEMTDLNGHGFAKLVSTYITGTNRSLKTTYSGQDVNGNNVKFNIYTTGGQTMVANMIFLADPEDFDVLLPEMDKVASSLVINFFTPGAFGN